MTKVNIFWRITSMADEQRIFKVESIKRTDKFLDHSRKPEYIAFNQAINDVLKKDNRTTAGLLVSIAAGLKQYHLENTFSVGFVLNESYLRGIEAIDKGKDIPKPLAWLRLTSRNVIKELSRGEKKNQHADNVDELPENTADDNIWKSPRSAKYQRMRQAFGQLSPIDQKILTLKVVEGYRWDKVQDQLEEAGYGKHTLIALRQRKRRALTRLRIIYEKAE